MTIDVRTYHGSSQDLSQFIVQTWLASYGGKMIVPDWSAEYLDWQMTGEDYQDRDYLVTAWDADRLVGTMLSMPFPMLVNGEEKLGSHGSWLSVDAEYRRHGVASLLAKEMQRRQQEKNCYARLGYAFQGARVSMGPGFWKKSQKKNTSRIRSMSLWARVLNPRKVSQWSNKSLERIFLKVLPQWVCGVGTPSAKVQIRPYEFADLAACQVLINQQARKADLAVLWTADRLQKHLAYGELSQTLVVERAGEVVGFLNYHHLGLYLHGRINAAIIDLLACDQLSTRETLALLNTALQQMKQQGTDLILMREFSGQPMQALLRARFVPQLPESELLMSASHDQETNDHKMLKKLHVLWR